MLVQNGWQMKLFQKNATRVICPFVRLTKYVFLFKGKLKNNIRKQNKLEYGSEWRVLFHSLACQQIKA